MNHPTNVFEEWAQEKVMDGGSSDFLAVDGGPHYELLQGPFEEGDVFEWNLLEIRTLENALMEHERPVEYFFNEDDRTTFLGLYAIVYYTDGNSGWSDVYLYKTKEELDEAWAEFTSECEELNGPQDDDIVTYDYVTFFEYGRSPQAALFTVQDDEDFREVAREWTKQSNWSPNIWFIDDHGGHMLLKGIYEG